MPLIFRLSAIYSASYYLYGHISAGGSSISHLWLIGSFAKINNPQCEHLKYGLLRLLILTTAHPPQLGQTTIFEVIGENIRHFNV